MTTKKRFLEIDKEVKEAVKELLDYAMKHNKDKYILWLADAEYNASYEKTRHSPYVLSSRVDYYKEEGRLAFSEFYLNKIYNFPPGTTQTVDHPFWLQLEMMIYSHVWESNKFLKQLFRLKEIVSGRQYPWKVDVPEFYKHNFIRLELRDAFKAKNLKVAEVITKGFHTSLRNSFLHSEYEIDFTAAIIHLHTRRVGKKQPFEMDEMSFDLWTERFLYTIFLNYHFVKEKYARQKSVKNDFKTDEFQLAWPLTQNKTKVITLYYDESRTSFSSRKAAPYIPLIPSPAISPQSPTSIQLPPLIAPQELTTLENKMNASVSDLLNKLEAANPDQYLCWLFEIRYDEKSKKYVSHVIEDKTRLDFSITLFNELYVDKNVGNLPELIRIQMELLIYSHIWESKPLLHQLLTALNILEGNNMNWDEDLDSDRRELINDIVSRLNAKMCAIATVIDDGFHTSLRNAFAHSDYDIDIRNKMIYLDTYKEERSAWDIKEVSFADWHNRFLLSIGLDLQLYVARDHARKQVPAKDLKELLDRLNVDL